MKSTKQARRDAKQLFRSCRVDGALDEGRVREVVRRVAEGKPRGYLGILGCFQRLVKLELESRMATIESALPLEPGIQEGLRADLARIYGPELAFSFKHSPSLIGGVRIKVGSDVYDGSVQARLERLEASF